MTDTETTQQQIDTVLEQYHRGQLEPWEALNEITRIKTEARRQQQ